VLALYRVNFVVKWPSVREASDSLFFERVDGGCGSVGCRSFVFGVLWYVSPSPACTV
jgi:hypothetical protein